MAHQVSVQHAGDPSLRGRYVADATDSGYGGSVVDGSSSEGDNLFDKSFSSEVQSREYLQSDRQQEIYKENCLLLTGSIEETKHLLNVFPSSVVWTDFNRTSSLTMIPNGHWSILNINKTSKHRLSPLHHVGRP